jgi:hypothetical protein
VGLQDQACNIRQHQKVQIKFHDKRVFLKRGSGHEEMFSLASTYTSIKTIISIETIMDCILHHMGVKTPFLNGVIEEELYIKQLQGSEVHGRDSHVCRLKKALYGINEACRAWYSRIDEYLMILGLTNTEVDTNIY